MIRRGWGCCRSSCKCGIFGGGHGGNSGSLRRSGCDEDELSKLDEDFYVEGKEGGGVS